MSGIHAAARTGFSAEAKTYARGRPGYTEELLPWLEGQLAVGPGRVVVDLGAGTGKFTRLLSRSGADVVAVEPVAQMRAQLALDQPAVRAVEGTAEAMPLATASVDAVLCAQAFHWFANAGALAEIHRVLRPGGRLGLVWNVRDETVDWVAAITRIITPYEGDAPRFYKGDWRLPFLEGTAAACFSPPVATVFRYVHEGSIQDVIIDRFMSVSFIAALAAADRAAVAAALRELAATHPALRGRDRIAFPYRTEAYRCDRL